ncbi:MAG TPA: hypothetical protein VK859_02705 [bacterium]|jgi:hypothetical protein|nr:hypothetical protein [bacterium]
MILSALLLLGEMIAGYFFLGGSDFIQQNRFEWLLAGAFLYAVLLTAQMLLMGWMTQEKGIAKLLQGTVVAHSPWLLGFGWPMVERLNLPEPHNFTLRKFQILLGVIVVTHLFLFARLLLSGSYNKGWKNSKIFGLVAAVLFTGTTLWTASVCDPSGDEPHYLLMAYSLIHDGDLDLSNNYANKDYEQFYHRGVLEPQGLEHVVDGKRYSHHPLGPVLLILPGFLIAGRLGAALTMALLAALALYLTIRVLEETGAKGWVLHATGIVGLFSSPLLLFSGLIFPEIPTACLVALSLLLFIRKKWAWLGLCLGLMLWMHNRNVLIIIPFLFFVLFEILKDKKNRMAEAGKFAIGFGAPITLLVVYFYCLYGVLTPLGAHNEPFTSLFRLSHFWDGFFGLLLDQECGLWFHFPIFGMAVTGGVLLWRSRNPLGHAVVGVLIFYYLFMSFYENLGLTPATRYWVGVTPLLLVALYPALERIKKWEGWAWLTVLSLAVGVFVNWLLAAVPWMRYNKLNGENWILKIAGSFLHLPLTSMNPAFQAPVVEAKSYLMSAVTMAITFGLCFWFLKDKKAASK